MNSPKVRELLARVFAISYQDDTETTTQADVEPDQDGVVVVVPELSEVDRKALVKQRWLNAINKVRDEISQVGAFSILRPTTSIPSHDRSGRTARCVAKGIRGVSCFVWLSAL